jgi:hypothetical protein
MKQAERQLHAIMFSFKSRLIAALLLTTKVQAVSVVVGFRWTSAGICDSVETEAINTGVEDAINVVLQEYQVDTVVEWIEGSSNEGRRNLPECEDYQCVWKCGHGGSPGACHTACSGCPSVFDRRSLRDGRKLSDADLIQLGADVQAACTVGITTTSVSSQCIPFANQAQCDIAIHGDGFDLYAYANGSVALQTP